MIRLTERQYRKLLRGESIGRASKYLNRKTVLDGVRFDSAFEAQHYAALKLRLQVGEIRDLRWQVDFPLVVNGVPICKYRADFVYEERTLSAWARRIVDTKSEHTRRLRDYRIKYKLMAALGFPITEVVSPSRRRRTRR